MLFCDKTPFLCYFESMTSPKTTLVNLTGPDQTAAEMLRLVFAYAADLGEKAAWSLPRFFDYVRKLPYKMDPKGVETLSRPRYLMLQEWPWRDCDDKAILIGSYCFLNKIPFRFVAASNQTNKELHHVYVVATINGKDYPIDSTYQNNTLGKEYPATFKQNLTGNIMAQQMTLEGYRDLAGVSSILKKAGKVAKRGANFVIKTPGVKDAIASVIPGGPAALAKARAAAAKAKAAQAAAKSKSGSIIDSIPTDGAAIVDQVKGLPKWALPAAGAAVFGLYLISRRK